MVTSFIKTTNDTLTSIGDIQIKSLLLCRNPIQSEIDILINALSLGSWTKVKKSLPYDKIFHLFCIVSLIDNTKVLVEKNANIIMKKISELPRIYESYAEINVSSYGSTKLTLNSVVNGMKQNYIGGVERLIRYTAFDDNCQKFLLNFIDNCGINNALRIKSSEHLNVKQFVFQDIEQASEKIPEITKSIANKITDLGAQVEKIVADTPIISTILGYKRGGVIKPIKKQKRKNFRKF